MKFPSPEEIEQLHILATQSKTFKRIVEENNLGDKRVLDMGCAYGSFMKLFGPDSVGITTTPHEVEYGKTAELDIRLGNVELLDQVIDPDTDHFDAFWGNNLFEHLRSPHAFLVQMKQFAAPDALLILGVPMIPTPPQLMKIKKFRGALASPHVNFFTKETFKCTVQYAGWDVQVCRSYHFGSKLLDGITTPIAPHLYIVAKNNPDYQYPRKKIKEWEHAEHYADLLRIMSSKQNGEP